MNLGMVECRVQLLGHCDLDIRPRFKEIRVGSISLKLFEVGIPNLVCGCILEWQSIVYHNSVTVTLTWTPDLVFRIIVSRACLLLFEVGILNLVCGCILG